MSKILQIDSSIFGPNGESSQLSQKLVEGLKSANDSTDLVHRDLSVDPVPHFDAQTVKQISDKQATLADTLISELKDADILVISAPMYNFAVPTQLKAWFDHITRAGVTFKYTENGPVGLVGDKKVIVVATSGGQHTNTERDAVEPWLRTILGFIGLDKDLHFIRAAGLSMSSAKEQAKIDAEKQIEAVIQFTKNEGASS